MFKKRPVIIFILFILISVLAIKEYSNARVPILHSTSAILIDESADELLFEKDAETAYPVASLSKLMTSYIILEHIENESIDWNDLVTISSTANDIIDSAAKIPVNNGTQLTIHDLFQAMVIASSNNAAIALAEYIAGSEAEFTNLMNKRAEELGLSNRTNFVNVTGLPSEEGENKMSARDVAMLAHRLVRAYPEILEATHLTHDYIPSLGIDLYNTNDMLNKGNSEAYFKGVDGLKTGYTDAAGFCFVGTAKRGKKRLISVVINAETSEQRFNETKKLLTYGFSKFKKTE